MSIQDPPRVLNEYQRDDLILRNLHLVNLIAKEYKFIDRNKHEDLIQEGRLGLIKAAENFDSSTKLSFKTYAIYKIRYSIQDYLRKQSTLVNVPHNRLCKAYRLIKFKNSYTLINNGAPPSHNEMKGFLNCNEEYLEDILFIVEILNNEFEKLEEIKIIKKNKIHTKVLIKSVFLFIDLLSDKEQFILKKKYFESKSFRNIGKNLNISHEMVRKLHNSAIDKVKKMATKTKV